MTTAKPVVKAERLRRVINTLDARRTSLHAALRRRRATLSAYAVVLTDLDTAMERARLRAETERRRA
jgi:5-methylcytosine-specific restriction endonuclease McrBC GTP-binding regulatory subunit McrB